VNEYLLPVLRRLFIVDDQGGVAISNNAVGRPVLASERNDRGIDDDPFVVHVGLNAHVRQVDIGILKQFELIERLVLTENQPDIDAILDLLGDGLDQRSTGLRRQVFNCSGFDDIPGDQVRSESDPPVADPAVNQAFDHAGTTWEFYNQIFKRESVDGHGRTLTSSVHYSQNYDNAFWNGQQMVYGDGDGRVFQNFTNALEVIGHELTHGVTQFTAQLLYRDQPGALNESFSDVFGSMVKQWSLGESVDEADWLIGAGILAPGVRGRALRDMANPGTAFDDPLLGKDPQPGHMKDYVDSADDNGGATPIPASPISRSSARRKRSAAAPGTSPAGSGMSPTERLTAQADFLKCANETVSVARDLYPQDASIADRVAKAWADVGVLSAPGAAVSAVAFAPAHGAGWRRYPQCRDCGHAKASPQEIEEGIEWERKLDEIGGRAQRRLRRHNPPRRTRWQRPHARTTRGSPEAR
jgi:hypothetical protein